MIANVRAGTVSEKHQVVATQQQRDDRKAARSRNDRKARKSQDDLVQRIENLMTKRKTEAVDRTNRSGPKKKKRKMLWSAVKILRIR